MAANTRPPRTGEVPTNITTQEVPTIGVLSSLGGLNTITDLQVPTVTTIVAVENIGVEEEEVEELLTSAGDRNRGGDMIMIGLRLMIAPPIMTVVGPHLIIEAVSTTEGEAVSTTEATIEATTEATTEGEAVLTIVDVLMTVPVTVSAGSDRLDSQDRPEEDTIIIRMGVWTASVLVLVVAAVVARAT